MGFLGGSSIDKVHDFDKCLETINPWVELLKGNIEEFLIKHTLKTIPFDTLENIQYQKNGIDVIVKSEKGNWEAKIRDNKYYLKKILLETLSIVENNTLGWLHTCQADAIAYCWFNQSKTNLMPQGYIILIQKLRETEWYHKLPKLYRENTANSRRGNQKWTTHFILVPAKDFPSGTLYPFKPTLKINSYQQTTLQQTTSSPPLVDFMDP